MNRFLCCWWLVLCARRVQAWSRPSPFRMRVPFLSLAEEEPSNEQLPIQEEAVIPQANYGVSFMGGDPCGSKYNDDPFDATKDKNPGIPDDVKARIAALAEQKKKEMEQAKKNTSN